MTPPSPLLPATRDETKERRSVFRRKLEQLRMKREEQRDDFLSPPSSSSCPPPLLPLLPEKNTRNPFQKKHLKGHYLGGGFLEKFKSLRSRKNEENEKNGRNFFKNLEETLNPKNEKEKGRKIEKRKSSFVFRIKEKEPEKQGNFDKLSEKILKLEKQENNSRKKIRIKVRRREQEKPAFFPKKSVLLADKSLKNAEKPNNNRKRTKKNFRIGEIMMRIEKMQAGNSSVEVRGSAPPESLLCPPPLPLTLPTTACSSPSPLPAAPRVKRGGGDMGKEGGGDGGGGEGKVEPRKEGKPAEQSDVSEDAGVKLVQSIERSVQVGCTKVLSQASPMLCVDEPGVRFRWGGGWGGRGASHLPRKVAYPQKTTRGLSFGRGSLSSGLAFQAVEESEDEGSVPLTSVPCLV